MSAILDPFYQPRSQQEIEQQPLTPNEWANTRAAINQVTKLLQVRRDELTTLEARIHLMGRKNNQGNVTQLLPKKSVVASIISDLEQMLSEMQIRMEILNLEVERNLQALPPLYEDLATRSESLFAHLCSGEDRGHVTEQMQASFEDVAAIIDYLHHLGYPLDEQSYRASQVRIREALRLPASSHPQMVTQIQDWLTRRDQECGEDAAFYHSEEADQGISIDSLLGDYTH